MKTANKLESIATAALAPYARNARTHSPEQVEQIKRSIIAFGFTNPVLIDASGGIVAGHGRVMAAKLMGLEQVPCLRIDWLTKAQRRAYVLADNQLALNSGWDEEMLAQELRDLEAQEFDLSLTGFAEDDLADLLFEPPAGSADSADDVPPMQEEAVSHAGDIWVLGAHRLMCGDGTKQDNVASLMLGEKADMVFCDPPYGVNYSGAGSVHESHIRAAAAKGKTHKVHREIENDSMNDAEQSAFWLALFQRIYEVIGGGVAFYICAPQGGHMMMMMMMMRDAGIPQRHELIWAKGHFVMGRADYHYQHEPILYGWKEGAAHRWYGDRKQSSLWQFNKPQKSDLHPTMKPVELVEFAIGNSSKIGDVVLDLCGGSGTTLVASEKTGRVCRMMELDRLYADVIVRRWQKFTGKRATHAVTGQPFPLD